MVLKIIYIALGVIALLILGVFIFSSFLGAQSKKRAKTWLATHSQTPLTKEQKRLLTFGAILAKYRYEEPLNLVFDGDPQEYRDGLSNQWEISNREEALGVLNNLLALKRSREFDTLLQREDAAAGLQSLCREVASELQIDIAEVQRVGSTYAWDVCRLVALAKWCYWLDYISLEEMWSFVERGAQHASTVGLDWREYTISFLMGRLVAGHGIEDICDDCQELLRGEDENLLYQSYSFK